MHLLCLTLLLPLTALPQGENPEKEQFASWWRDLAGDSERAYRAMWQFVEHPKAAATFLRKQIQPVKAADPKALAQLVKDLSSDEFAVRAKATRELEKLGHLAKEALSKAAKSELPLEVQRRVEVLLRKLIGPPTDVADVRAVRAVEILELIGDEDAREVLKFWASGAPTAILTEESHDSLTRIDTRPPLVPIAPGQKADSDGEAFPHGALVRLGTTRFRSGAGYASAKVLFSPDASQVVLLGGPNIRFMNAITGKVEHELKIPIGGAPILAFSPERKLVAASFYDGSTKQGVLSALDWPSCKEIMRVSFQLGLAPTSLAITEKRTILAFMGNNTLREWDPVEKLQRMSKSLYKDFRGYKLSPDGRFVLGHFKEGLYVWEWQSDKPPRRLASSDRSNPNVEFSADGNMLALEDDGESVEVWDVASGRLLHRLFLAQKRPGIECMRFSPDGNYLATIHYYERNVVWDLATGKPRHEFFNFNQPYGFNRNAAFSHDGKRLAVSGYVGAIVWDLEKSAAMQDDIGHRGEVVGMKFSPKGDLLATAGSDGTVRIWDAATSKQRHVFRQDAPIRIPEIAFYSDGRLLAGAGLDDSVRVWEPYTGKQVFKLFGHGRTGGWDRIAFSSNGGELCSWGGDCYLRSWDMKTGRATAEHRIFPQGEAPADAPEGHIPSFGGIFTPDAKLFGISHGDGMLTFIDVHSGKEAKGLPTKAETPRELAMSANGKYLASRPTLWENDVEIWHFPSRSLAQVVGTGKDVRSVAWSPDGRSLAVVADHKVTVFETASGKARVRLDKLEGLPRLLAIAPDGRRLAVAFLDTSILVIDLPTLARAQ